MENQINIFIGLASIIGTMLAVLLGFSSYKQDQFELNLENVLVGLSEDIHPEFNCFPKGFSHYEQKCKIYAEISRYNREYNGLSSFMLKSKTTNILCNILCFFMISLISYSFLLTANYSICTTITFFFICEFFFIYLINNLIPFDKKPKENFPTIDELLNANYQLRTYNPRINLDLPLKLFIACNPINVYDLDETANNTLLKTSEQKQFLQQQNIDFEMCKSIAKFVIPTGFKFNFIIDFFYINKDKNTFDISNSSSTCNTNLIYFNLPFVYKDIASIRMNVKPLNDKSDKRYTAVYIGNNLQSSFHQLWPAIIIQENNMAQDLVCNIINFLTPPELVKNE